MIEKRVDPDPDPDSDPDPQHCFLQLRQEENYKVTEINYIFPFASNYMLKRI